MALGLVTGLRMEVMFTQSPAKFALLETQVILHGCVG
jgi:hypothetical protein